ncbi:DUF4430 domain-containing protein [Clostridiaceae bacterium 35-E11]
MRSKISFLLCWVVILICTACTQQTTLENQEIRVIVSKDFGSETLHDQKMRLTENMSVMEIMEENFTIEIAYGGGFINGIDGFKSGFTGMKDKKKIDWFYYVNGILAEVGSDEYELKPNDFIIWDYHHWNSAYGSSIIGAYPINFTNAYEGNPLEIEILYEKDYKQEGENLLKDLKKKGTNHIALEPLNGKELKNGSMHSVVIGSWEKVSQMSYVKEIYENRGKTGLFFNMGTKIEVLNDQGVRIKAYEKGAVIASVLKAYGEMGTLWMITGNDQECIQKAAALIYRYPEQIEGAFSVFVSKDEILRMPIKS